MAERLTLSLSPASGATGPSVELLERRGQEANLVTGGGTGFSELQTLRTGKDLDLPPLYR